MAWELINEPRCQIDPSGKTLDVSHACDISTYFPCFHACIHASKYLFIYLFIASIIRRIDDNNNNNNILYIDIKIYCMLLVNQRSMHKINVFGYIFNFLRNHHNFSPYLHDNWRSLYIYWIMNLEFIFVKMNYVWKNLVKEILEIFYKLFISFKIMIIYIYIYISI